MKKLIFILMGLIACLTFTPSGYSFSIEPGRIELSVPAGGQRGRSVRIDNSNSDAPLHLRIYAQDILFLPDGTHDFPPAGSTQWSCANWLRIIPEEIDIPAGKTQDIRVNLSIPEGAKGGYYAMLFFESGPGFVEKGLGINFRLGVIVEVTIPKTEVFKAKLANIVFVKPKDICVEIFNEGNVLVRPKGKIKIFDSAGKRIKQLDFNPQRLGVLPNTLRKFYLELDEPLNKGAYKLRIEVDYGTKYLLVGEIPIEME